VSIRGIDRRVAKLVIVASAVAVLVDAFGQLGSYLMARAADWGIAGQLPRNIESGFYEGRGRAWERSLA
jgi:hypothetical protein